MSFSNVSFLSLSRSWSFNAIFLCFTDKHWNRLLSEADTSVSVHFKEHFWQTYVRNDSCSNGSEQHIWMSGPPLTWSWVSEGTVPFLTAGERVRTRAAAAETPAALEGEQQPAQPSPAPCPAIRALSVEEENILQSLDCLNQRLQSKLDNKWDPTSSD